jgi:prepilin-type N-terminal cleavage/methylation domain-containing protein
MHNEKGFSLIELLIVVAVILVIAAIAIPSLLRAKIAANEASAVHTVREISTAEVGYHTTFTSIGFAPTLVNLGGPQPCTPSVLTACILDDQVSTGLKSGYQFFAAGFASGGSTVNTEYVASSAPLSFNQSGIRDFCMVTDGVLRIQTGGPGIPPAPTVAACLAYPIAQ